MLPDVSNEVVYDKATVDELLLREKDGRPLLRRLFEIYLEETPRLLEELEAAVAAKNEEEVYDVVHQMKGSAAALGARKLFRLTEVALSLCKDGEILKVDDLVERIEDESDAYIRDVSQILNQA
ncbi:Hpt domain-containing protein [Pelagicoccus sp. NFK12]|uniref:Hpt domain-containing protein n=1 Tax=Pelagicoccus enzymogenes TaxID=2773457 RepID=A0A927F6W2_9BACT|nr:Hpt domain-containing protein [Pelagicoccus enzymogenes]MBD5779567.1 Hpt domain-containing protein [Pelagicoccus enzymogenes]MDQ8200359.1 Hpt domain-containing protein [Pelagicoccus enzymogenes]